jgi:hypothetical protein
MPIYRYCCLCVLIVEALLSVLCEKLSALCGKKSIS